MICIARGGRTGLTTHIGIDHCHPNESGGEVGMIIHDNTVTEVIAHHGETIAETSGTGTLTTREFHLRDTTRMVTTHAM